MVSTASAGVKPGSGVPASSWISTRMPPAAEVAKLIASSLPANVKGFVSNSPPSYGRLDRGEAVQAERVAPEVAGRLPVVLVHEERHLVRAGLDHVERGVVGPRDPVLGPDPGGQEAIHEGAVVVVAAARRHQDGVGAVLEVAGIDADGLGLLGGEDLPARHEPRGDADGDVRGPEVRARLVRVEVLDRAVAVAHQHRLVQVRKSVEDVRAIRRKPSLNTRK